MMTCETLFARRIIRVFMRTGRAKAPDGYFGVPPILHPCEPSCFWFWFFLPFLPPTSSRAELIVRGDAGEAVYI